MAKGDSHTIEKNGFRFVFSYASRTEFNCDVYEGDALVAELCYPRFPGILDAFSAAVSYVGEAVHLANYEKERNGKSEEK